MSREEILEEQFGDLQLRHDESEAQLRRATKALERTKEEYKKLEERSQHQEMEIANLMSRIAKLEERANELDEKEERIELLTENLDKARSTIREKDFEVAQCRRKTELAEKEVETKQEKVDDLQMKNEDLKHQVRVEIERNTRMAQGLDEIEQMRELTAKTLKDMDTVNSELSDKTKLLASARRCIREYRDKTRDYDTFRDEVMRLREELQIAQYENHTLKRMMVGKDSLVVQKTQALDLARQLIEHLKLKDERVAGEVERLLERATFVPTFPVGDNKSERIIDQPHPLHDSGLNSGLNSVSHSDLSETRSGTSLVSRTSSLRSNLRPMSMTTRDLLDIRSVPFMRPCSEMTASQGGPSSVASGSTGSRLQMKGTGRGNGHSNGVHERARSPGPRQGLGGRPQTAVVRPQQRSLMPTCESGPSSDGESNGGGGRTAKSAASTRRVGGLARSEVERVSSLFVHLGDRVQATLPDDGTPHLATVKYIGQLDKGPQDRRIFVGLKLDESLGDCDGTHNGVRYFNVAQHRGRIVRVSAIRSVFNIKTEQFRSMDECLREYAKHRRQ